MRVRPLLLLVLLSACASEAAPAADEPDATGTDASGEGGATDAGATPDTSTDAAPSPDASVDGSKGDTGGTVDTGTPPTDTGAAVDTGTVVDTGPPTTCVAEPTHSGGLTQYDKTSMGNCGVPWPADDMFAAMATADYSTPGPAGPCGACVKITGPTGLEAVVHVVDQCPIGTNPKCVAGHIDLSRAAFAAVVPKTYPYGGEVPNDKPIDWRYVPCTVTGNIVYHFKDGTNPYWIGVHVRNARYAIKTIRYRSGSTWVDATPRTDPLPYFVITGYGKSTIDLQAIDKHGHVLEDDGLAVKADYDAPGKAQFPLCP